MGYVGLTLSVAIAQAGIYVFGSEKNPDTLKSLNDNKAHFSEKGLNEVLNTTVKNNKLEFGSSIPTDMNFDCFIITVGTPLDDNGIPRKDMVISATNEVAEVLTDGALVILRSTVEVGTTSLVVKPILRNTKKAFHLAMCPERTLEGRALEEIRFLPQIIGPDSEETSFLCTKLFNHITFKTIVVSNPETAEVIKLADNSYRDVRFAFANEIAKACSYLDVNCYEVINAGKSDYERTNIDKPGLVGGPCLEKDPHIFNYSVQNKGGELSIIHSSRTTNENQIFEVSDLLKQNLINSNISNPKILLCGMAFKGKPETDDLRGSMSLKILKEFKKSYSDITVFDNVVSDKYLEVFGEVLPDLKVSNNFDLILIMNNHSIFETTGLNVFKNLLSDRGKIFDFWNNFYNLDYNHSENYYYNFGNLYKLKG